MPTTKEQFCKVHNGTDPIVHCVKGDFYPKQEESIPIPIAAEEYGKGGVFDIRGISADGCQTVVCDIVLGGMSKTDGLAVIDGTDIDTSTLELVDECLVECTAEPTLMCTF